MTAALYNRVSTRDKGEEVANKILQLRDLCAAQGWTIVREYEDHETGSRADRPIVQQMLNDATAGKFDVLAYRQRSTALFFTGAVETSIHTGWT